QQDPLFVERLQQVVDGVDLEGLHRVLIVGRRKDDLRHGDLLVDKLLDDAETVKARHLYVEKDQIGRVLSDQINCFQAVAAVRHYGDVIHRLEQVAEFVARQLLVVDDHRGEGHGNSIEASTRRLNFPTTHALRSWIFRSDSGRDRGGRQTA